MSILRLFPPRSAPWREALDNSQCSLKVDLLRWRLRFSAGIDRRNYDCELAHLYVDFGPVSLMLAIGH